MTLNPLPPNMCPPSGVRCYSRLACHGLSGFCPLITPREAAQTAQDPEGGCPWLRCRVEEGQEQHQCKHSTRGAQLGGDLVAGSGPVPEPGT